MDIIKPKSQFVKSIANNGSGNPDAKQRLYVKDLIKLENLIIHGPCNLMNGIEFYLLKRKYRREHSIIIKQLRPDVINKTRNVKTRA